jgi:antitoxin component HigA of HigAB toxin-antitoxin module
LPDTYFEWVRRHPLKSVQTDADLDAAQAVLDELLRTDLDAGGPAYLEALSDLIGVYEREHHAIRRFPRDQLLSYLLKERGVSQADLVRRTEQFGTVRADHQPFGPASFGRQTQ